MTGGARPAQADWIAVDWGTTALRAWAIRDGDAAATVAAETGMGGLAPDAFEPALLDAIGPWLGDGHMPVVACGMVGARQGWAEAPYRAVPCRPVGDAPMAVASADERLCVVIVPGLSQVSPPDVMRGEETQIAGFLARNPGWDGVICLPGTHSKWARVSAGEVVSFQTFMTGELFAVIAGQTVLRHSLGTDGWDDAAFAEALDDALSRPERLAARLFGLRAGALLDGLRPEAARARLSGLLIGAELAAARPYWLGQQIAVIGAAALAARYIEALTAQGVAPIRADVAAMTLAGLAAARRLMQEVAP